MASKIYPRKGGIGPLLETKTMNILTIKKYTRLILSLVIVFVSSGIPRLYSLALTNSDIKSIVSGTEWYSPDDECSAESTTNSFSSQPSGELNPFGLTYSDRQVVNDGKTLLLPNIVDDSKVIAAIKSYITNHAPSSSPFTDPQMADAILQGSKAAGINPFNIVMHAQLESSFGTAGIATQGSNNAFGAKADVNTPEDQVFVGGDGTRHRKWSSWLESVNSEISMPFRMRATYIDGTRMDGKFKGLVEMNNYLYIYAPPVDGDDDYLNPSGEYLSAFQAGINEMLAAAGDGIGPPTTVTVNGVNPEEAKKRDYQENLFKQQNPAYQHKRILVDPDTGALLKELPDEVAGAINTTTSTGTYSHISLGDIPIEGLRGVKATVFDTGSGDDNGVGYYYDDKFSNVKNAVVAELNNGTSMGGLNPAVGINGPKKGGPFAKIEIQYKGKSVIAEVGDKGAGDGSGTLDLHRETVRLLGGDPNNWSNGVGSGEEINIFAVPLDTPVTKWDGSASQTTITGGAGSCTQPQEASIKKKVPPPFTGQVMDNVTGIVIHYTAGNVNASVDDFIDAIRSNKACGDQGCSVQFFVAGNGDIWQLVDPINTHTSHALGANSCCIGIEIAGLNEAELLNNQVQKQSVINLVAYLKKTFNVQDTPDPPNLKGIMSHHNTPKGIGRKPDTGEQYYQEILAGVRNSSGDELSGGGCPSGVSSAAQYKEFCPQLKALLEGPDSKAISDLKQARLADGGLMAEDKAVSVGNARVDTAIKEQLQNMINAAKAAGITLEPVSGFRTFEEQALQRIKFCSDNQSDLSFARIFTSGGSTCSTVVMNPGEFNHNKGRAVDFGKNGLTDDNSFINSPDYTWLVANASQYGFSNNVVSPDGSESWHWSTDGN